MHVSHIVAPMSTLDCDELLINQKVATKKKKHISHSHDDAASSLLRTFKSFLKHHPEALHTSFTPYLIDGLQNSLQNFQLRNTPTNKKNTQDF